MPCRGPHGPRRIHTPITLMGRPSKMINQTKIEWCSHTWNPITGCLHGCSYCYARSIAHRFGIRGAEIGVTHIAERGQAFPWCIARWIMTARKAG